MFPSQVSGSSPLVEQQENLNFDDEQGCNENEALQILEQFEEVYRNKIDHVDRAADVTDAQRNELKVKIMSDWIKDLREQNTLLIRTVTDLEDAAISRVKILENKLQETSDLMTSNMSPPSESDETLAKTSKRIEQLENDLSCMQENSKYLENDINNLLALIKRGRIENNWYLEGLTFCVIAPSDIPAPDTTSEQIGCVIDNEENINNNKDSETESLYKELNDTEKYCNNLQHEHQCNMHDLQRIIQENSELKNENEKLNAWLEYERKESSEAHEALKRKIIRFEEQIKKSQSSLSPQEDAPNATRRVRISCDSSQTLENENVKEKLHDALRQIDELKSLLASKDIEISELRADSGNRDDNINKTVENSAHISVENQNEILGYLTNLHLSMTKEKEIISNLKMEFETVVANLVQTKFEYEKDQALVNERFKDMQLCLDQYKNEVLNNMRLKENLLLKINEVISRVSSSIKTISDFHESKNKSIASLEPLIKKYSNAIKICNKNTVKEYEQKAIFTAILQQFRMMEEFRICTVEVQAGTEDLREEMHNVISNLNSRHCKYTELNKIINQVQDYLKRTEDISEIINRIQLQHEERVRHNEGITHNRIRLKDIKNEFNHTQSELTKCLDNVHSNSQHFNLLGYTCNDLLTSVVEEVEQLECNLNTFQSQGCYELSTMTELREQFTFTDQKVKELKRKCSQVLMENEAAQKIFSDKFKRLEKYECEVDTCHTKMQDVLENIISIRDKMNELECIKEADISVESTNETIQLKEEIRRLQKESEELKRQLLKESINCPKTDEVLELENKVIDLNDTIKVLQNKIKFKNDDSTFLRQRIASLEKELLSKNTKSETHRKSSLTETFELKKKISELENLLRIQNDTENNVKRLASNETDSTKSQQLIDLHVKESLGAAAIKHGLQGSHETVPQLFNVLQCNIQAMRSGLQELSDKLKILILDGSSRTVSSNKSIEAAIDSLAKYMESIKNSAFEVEKIKVALYSKDKLMENMDEIIRIQKDSITITRSEVEDLHKTMQAKIDEQAKVITQYEKEKRQLNNEIELQIQTIGHLQNAIVEANRSIDQLSNKATSDKFYKGQIIRSLNAYLAETQNQYDDCYGEASKQAVLLELQRDAINLLQKKIGFLKFNDFLNAFILHFIYYVILLKYQDEIDCQNEKFLDLQSTMKETEKQCCNLVTKNSKLVDENDELRNNNERLKIQLLNNKLDFDLIEEEMKKMGIKNLSVKQFKTELEKMRLKNDNDEKTIADLKLVKKCLSQRTQQLTIRCELGETEVQLLNKKVNELQSYLERDCKQLRKVEAEKNDIYKKLCFTEGELSKMKNQCDSIFKNLLDRVQRNYNFENQSDVDTYDQCETKKNIQSDEITKLKKDFKDLQEKHSVKREELNDIKSKYCIMSSKIESSEKRHKDEIMLLEKKHACLNARFRSCTEKNVQLIRQNMSLEDNYSKSMTELEDIVLQLGDMNSSLVKLKTVSDTKSQALDSLSTELAKMKVSRSEVCEETKNVLEWVRKWMKEQKRTSSRLQERLCNKQQQISNITFEKRSSMASIKRLKRANMILKKRLKFIRKPTTKQTAVLCNGYDLDKLFSKQNDEDDVLLESTATYSCFKQDSGGKSNEIVEKSKGQYRLHPGLKHLSKQIPRTPQVSENIQKTRRTLDDSTDGGYKTSSAR